MDMSYHTSFAACLEKIRYNEAFLCYQKGGKTCDNPYNKVHGANMGPTWVLSAPEGSHVGPMNLAIRKFIAVQLWLIWPPPTILVAPDIVVIATVAVLIVLVVPAEYYNIQKATSDSKWCPYKLTRRGMSKYCVSYVWMNAPICQMLNKQLNSQYSSFEWIWF